MVFNPEQHKLDDQGFIADKKTGQRVGLENPVVPPAVHADYPKWVPVHESQVVRKDGHASTPRWPEYVIDRVTQKISVLVQSAEEEAEASRDVEAPAHHDPEPDPKNEK